jgi:hypothetical protein
MVAWNLVMKEVTFQLPYNTKDESGRNNFN